MKFQKALSIATLSAAAMILTSTAIADGYEEEYTETEYVPKVQTTKKTVTEVQTVRHEPVRHVTVVHESTMARSLSEVGAIRIRGGVCDTDIARELDDHGFVVAGSGANAILDVDMNTNGSLSRPHSVEEGIYSATLVGANGRVLFTTSGHEDAHNLASLCEDVGEDIADRLEDRVG